MALDEFDRIGREEFLRRYRFGKARAYFIVRNGMEYDSKAVLGAAHSYQYGHALPNEEFSGGAAGAARELRALGFTVIGPGKSSGQSNSSPRTFILTWNSLKWDWDAAGRPSQIEKTARGEHVPGRWATGNRTGGIQPGDRAFLLQQGPRRGMVASGWFTSEVFQEPHWDAVPGKVANYASVSWDKITSDGEMLDIQDIKAHVPGLNWDRIQGSAILLPANGALRLEELWGGGEAFASPEEEGAESLTEGTVARVTVNCYERSPAARSACLAHYGATCVVCSMSFGDRYGSIGEGFIHVHHLKEISSI